MFMIPHSEEPNRAKRIMNAQNAEARMLLPTDNDLEDIGVTKPILPLAAP